MVDRDANIVIFAVHMLNIIIRCFEINIWSNSIFKPKQKGKDFHVLYMKGRKGESNVLDQNVCVISRVLESKMSSGAAGRVWYMDPLVVQAYLSMRIMADATAAPAETEGVVSHAMRHASLCLCMPAL